MATFVSLPDGRFRVLIRRVGFKTRTKIFPSKKLANAWVHEVEGGMDSRKYKDPDKHVKESVGAIFERFRDDSALMGSRKGARWERVRINMLLRTADFMKRRVTQITPEDIRDWRNERLQKISPQSVNREMNLISGVFTHAINEWSYSFIGGINPCSQVSRPKGAKGVERDRRWEQHEIDLIVKTSGLSMDRPPTTGYQAVGWAVLLAIETAMRLSELCAFKRQDVRLDEVHIRLHDTKNGESRNVPLSKKAVELLAVLTQDKKPEDRIFPYEPNSLGTIFRQVRKDAGLEASGLKFHDTRHEAATRIAAKVPDALRLSKITGHKSLQQLRRYYNPKVKDLAEMLD